MHTNKRLKAAVLILFALGLAGCTLGAPSEKIKTGREITFIQATDIHYLAESLTDKGEAYEKFIKSGDGRQLLYIDEVMEAFTNDIKKKKADVLIVSGDLTTNGEKESHLELSKKLKTIEENGTSVFVIPGNHDILNPFARGFKGSNQYVVDHIDEKDFEKIYKDFGYKEAVLRDTNTLSYLAAPSEDVWLLMLDTALYDDNMQKKMPRLDGEINQGTLEWIKKCSNLAKKNNAQIIAVMHHNLIDHSEVIKEGYTINNSKTVLQLFESWGIKLALSGHTHIQDIKSYESGQYKVYDIVTSALVAYPQKYGILKYSKNAGFDYSSSSTDVESWAKEKGIKDKNLINFKEYSEGYFKDSMYETTLQRLLMEDIYSIEESKLIAETTALIRTKYYGSTGRINKEEIINSPGYKLLVNSGTQQRIMKMLDSDNTAINNLQISAFLKN
jgi:3',5'-cyclic AMP phosphodiesterase CpdA